jgi:HD-like signal output (HDOD) protein
VSEIAERELCPAQIRRIARELAPEIASLPRLSCVVEQFLLSAGRDTASAGDIAAALGLDPLLRDWVLRQANSGFCKLNLPVGSVAEACVVLGLELVTRLVYAACTRDLLRRRLVCYRYPANGFWLHGLAVGLAARRLAALLGDASPLGVEQAQVAGLLHDLGKLLLDRRLPRAGGPRDVAPDEERACAGYDHGVHSAAIAVAWGLPAPVSLAVALHHAGEPPAPARLIAVADRLMIDWQVGSAVYPQVERPLPLEELAALAAPLGASPALLARWGGELPPLVSGLAEMVKQLGHGAPPALPAAGPHPEPGAMPAADPVRGHRTRERRPARRTGRAGNRRRLRRRD